MQGPKTLLECEDHWVTDMGAWFPGERVVFRGKDLFQELGDSSWMGLLLYGITGREFNEKQLRLFEGIWTISTSYPDPRLWNNRVAALAGSARSTSALGVGAATAVSEASIYGRRPATYSIDFMFRTKTKLELGIGLPEIIRLELKKYRTIFGYGRPVVQTDERIEPLMTIVNQLGFANGEFIKLAFSIENVLLDGRWRMHMNIGAVIAALAADQDFTARELSEYLVLCFSAGILACNIDAYTKPAGSLFPLHCNRIRYQGVSSRSWNK
jgi:hypothetical protein